MTMRTKAILLVRDAVSALNSNSDDRKTGLGVILWVVIDLNCSPLGSGEADIRRESRHRLVRALDEFSNDLIGNLERFVTLGDSSGVETIWACCVACLAHLATLCNLIGRTEPASTKSMDSLCDQTLEKLGNVSLEVRIEQYTHLDVLTGVRILAVPLWMSRANQGY